jgi:hypothetical protein
MLGSRGHVLPLEVRWLAAVEEHVRNRVKGIRYEHGRAEAVDIISNGPKALERDQNVKHNGLDASNYPCLASVLAAHRMLEVNQLSQAI